MGQDSQGLHRNLQSAVEFRDRAVTRVRRLTLVTALAAAVAASGLGVLIASEPVAHSAAVSGGEGSTTTTTTTTTGKGSAGTSDTTTTGSSGAVVTSPTTTTPATTVSGQS